MFQNVLHFYLAESAMLNLFLLQAHYRTSEWLSNVVQCGTSFEESFSLFYLS